MSCDQIPSAENNNQGQNSTRLLQRGSLGADDRVGPGASTRPQRIEQIHQIGQYLVDDHVMLPLYQFPNIAAWRTDKLGGPVDAVTRATTMSAFKNLNKWEPPGRQRHHHRCRAVAGLHQPGHGVRQLLVDGVDDGLPAPSERVGHDRRRV